MHLALRILVVDNEPTRLRVRKLILEHEGDEVCAVDSGAAALDQLAERKFDLVITNFWMPGMNGGQLVVRIRQLNPTQPIIMYSMAEPDYKILLGEPSARVDALLLEPFSCQDMREAIECVLKDVDARA